MPNISGVNSGQGIMALSSSSSAPQSEVGQVVGAVISPSAGPSTHSKLGVLYAPFMSKDVLQMAVGKNLPRAANGKALRPLICRNDQEQKALEIIRKKGIEDLNKQCQSKGPDEESRPKGAVPKGSAADAKKTQKADKARAERERLTHINDVLKCIEIRSNEGGGELARLKSEQHKLYIIGHGCAGKKNLAADSTGQEGKVSATEIAQQLKEGGLNKGFYDIRVTACYSADTRKPASFSPKDLERAVKPKIGKTFGLFGKPKITAEPFAQTLSNKLKQAGFDRPSVAGYHSAGVMLPREHQTRRIVDSQVDDVRSSAAMRRFTPV